MQVEEQGQETSLYILPHLLFVRPEWKPHYISAEEDGLLSHAAARLGEK